MFALCFLAIGAVLTARNADHSSCRMEEDSVISRRFVYPEDVCFAKYPVGGIDYVVSMFPMNAAVSRRGRFYSTLSFRRTLTHKFERKNKLLQRNGDGAYLTHAAALKDIIIGWSLKESSMRCRLVDGLKMKLKQIVPEKVTCFFLFLFISSGPLLTCRSCHF